MKPLRLSILHRILEAITQINAPQKTITLISRRSKVQFDTVGQYLLSLEAQEYVTLNKDETRHYNVILLPKGVDLLNAIRHLNTFGLDIY